MSDLYSRMYGEKDTDNASEIIPKDIEIEKSLEENKLKRIIQDQYSSIENLKRENRRLASRLDSLFNSVKSDIVDIKNDLANKVNRR